METRCKKCNAPLKIPELTEDVRRRIWEVRESPLRVIQLFIEITDLDLKQAKALGFHFNREYGQCVGCGYTRLEGENIDCPQCGSFNMNWKLTE